MNHLHLDQLQGASRLQSGDKAHVNDSVAPRPRRKRVFEAADISGMPCHKKEVDESIVGSKIKVWWPVDEIFYDAIVDSYDPYTKKHKIVYADGDVEVLLLKDEHWKYLEGDTENERGKRKAKWNASQMNRLHLDLLQGASRLQGGDKTHVNDSVAPRPRRKRVFDTADISGMPCHKKEVYESLVGSKIKVWWPVDEIFYDAIVDSYDPYTKKHKIVYADGDVEVLLLKNELWKYLEGDTENERGKRKAKWNASQMPQTKKPKLYTNIMPEQAKSHEQSRSGTEASDKRSPRPSGWPKKGTSDLGKLFNDVPLEISTKSEGKSAIYNKAKTPISNEKLKDIAETEPGVKTHRNSSKREEFGNKSKHSTSKISDKSKDEPSKSGEKAKSETPEAITKLKVYTCKGRGKLVDNTTTKDSTPRTESRSKAYKVAKIRIPKIGTDLEASSVSSKGKRKVEENENAVPLSHGNPTTGGKKHKRKGRKVKLEIRFHGTLVFRFK